MSERTPTPKATATETPTPGPWKAREQITKDNRSLGWIIEHANGRIGWSDYATTNVGEDPPFPISEANAALIAAAPDLLTVAIELDRLSLVIESAVRNADRGNHTAILALLQANHVAIAKVRVS